MQDKPRCQSCGMPLADAWLGSEKDGKKNPEYCTMCYAGGAFTDPAMTKEKMVQMSIDYMTSKMNFSKEDATKMSNEVIPKLRRWSGFITIPGKDSPFAAYFRVPQGVGPFSAVIVIQEAFGVNAHIQSVCDRLTRECYVVVAPDLFHRWGDRIIVDYKDMPRAFEFLGKISNQMIHDDLEDSIAFIREHPAVNAKNVGIVGFCMGGFSSFLAACRFDLQASAVFYGGGIVNSRAGIGLSPIVDEAANPKAPMICFFGADDASISQSDVETIKTKLQQAKPRHEVHIYPGAGHAFFNDMRENYRVEAANDAWGKTLRWFGEFLNRGR